MSEYTEDFFVKCWIIFKTRHPRQAKRMDSIEAEVIGAVPVSAKPEKENKEDATDQQVTVV